MGKGGGGVNSKKVLVRFKLRNEDKIHQIRMTSSDFFALQNNPEIEFYEVIGRFKKK